MCCSPIGCLLLSGALRRDRSATQIPANPVLECDELACLPLSNRSASIEKRIWLMLFRMGPGAAARCVILGIDRQKPFGSVSSDRQVWASLQQRTLHRAGR